jgi:phosphonate transport system substrate-binding protein
MKRLLTLILLGLLACTLPAGVDQIFQTTAIPAPISTNTPALGPSLSPQATPGTDKNPFVLALQPSSTQPDQSILTAGNTLAALLEKSTGYKIISVVPPNETELIKSFGLKNAHMGVLSPAGYLLASGQGYVEAAFAREQSRNIFYGAQFIARSDAGFTPYYDPIKDENTADATTALAQFKDKKPCWTDEHSPSGYIVPLGFLSDAGVQVLEPAFVTGHPTVVRAVYAGGICDFGATYIDARTYPGLEDQYPDVMTKVVVIWQVPAIIPYETLVFERGMDENQRRSLIRAFVDLMATTDGKSAMQTLYGFDAMQVVQDSQYDDFRKAVKASGLDLITLVK